MTAKGVMRQLDDIGAKLSLEDDQTLCLEAPEGAVPAELFPEIQRCKWELVAMAAARDEHRAAIANAQRLFDGATITEHQWTDTA